MSEFLSTADAENQHADERRSRSAVPPIRATDGERLMRFWRHRDESAFAEVVELHAGLVWGVCSQVLRRREDVEDAFQATFLILARKAKSIRAADSAAGWLYRVAFRTALLARNRRLRMTEESLLHEPATDDDQLEAIARNEQCLVLLEELHALPTQYRQPLVLCYLEGRSRSEADDELGVTPQTVKGALARGTRMLRSRLVSRGAALSTTMAVVSASIVTAQAAAAPMLISHTAALGAGFALKLAGAGATATAVKGGAATILAEKGILAMTIAAAAKPAVAVLGVCLTAGSLAVATADAPRGVGLRDQGVLLLAASEAGDLSDDEATSGDVEIAAGDSEKTDVDAENPLPGLEIAGAADKSEPAPWVSADHAEPADTANALARVFAARKEVAVPTRPTADLLITNPPGSPAPVVSSSLVGSDQRIFLRVPEPPNPPGLLPTELSPTRATGPSEASLKLEEEYWGIKGRALKKKAEALRQASQLDVKANEVTPGAVPQVRILEREAEVELAMAEVKLCEMNAMRVKEALGAVEANQFKEGAVGPEIEAIQRALNMRVKLSTPLDVDGEFGPLTEQAVMKFQKANRLTASGIVDAATSVALGLWELPAPTAGADASQVMAPHELRAHDEAKLAAKAAVAAAAKAGRQAE
ncbi:MAG: sigma-70 family RNA polymerase sigma factor, partial [Pirellulales bacterium]|nr:sigma-70 family RNA polymerase sigma factor [Pirellulales bacterium]